jgi:VWFA-related protein
MPGMILPSALAVLLALPQSGFQESIEVRIHNVDVVVTDAKGQVVTGLRQEDFELREDGALQRITNFSAYEGLVTPAPEANAATTEDVRPEPPPARSFLFFIDEMSLDRKTLASVTENLTTFVSTNLRPGDVAAVIRPTQVTNITLDLTSNHDAIRKQIVDALSGSDLSVKTKGLENDLYLFEREIRALEGNDEARAIARRYAERATRRVRQRLGTMRSLIASLAPVSGRKVLVAVTQNLSAQPGREYFERYVQRQTAKAMSGSGGVPPMAAAVDAAAVARGETFPPSGLDNTDRLRSGMADLRPAFEELARLASSNGVSFYAIRPENDMPLRAGTADLTNPDIGDGGIPAGPPDIGLGTTLQMAIKNTDAAINPLVDITGGRHFRPNDDLSVAMQQIADDVTNYYSLAYRGRGGLDKAHKIEVRVRNRPDLRVRSRNEVVRKSPKHELTDMVAAALVAPAEASNLLGISVTRAERASTSSELVLEIRIPIGALDFEKKGRTYRASYTAHYAVSGKATDYLSGLQKEELVEIPEADWQSARTKHWTHVITLTRVREESYRIAVGIMDVRSGTTGITTMSAD